ncbi:hypothetical protein [Sphingomonas sp. GB1N7]|uniref:hypothetical protein n=1 Tax=Parasphingomonas caseinilytica TaxID=3096158 RepID=UPI002FC5964A
MTNSAPVRGPHGVAIGLFILVWLSCIWFGSNEVNPNNATRMFAAISLAERGDATIDEFETMTVDKAQFNGHIYMDKMPGMTLMALPSVWIADRITGQRSELYPYTIRDARFIAFLRLRQLLTIATTSAVLIALAAVLLLDLGAGITGSPKAGLVAALGYALATPAWGWSTTVFGHAPVGALLMIAAWAVWRGTSGPRELARLRYPIMLGACLGWSLLIELTAVFPAAVVGLWAIWRTRHVPLAQRLRLAAIAAVAGAVLLSPMLVYNQIAFGQWFRLGYQGVVGFEGMNQGLFGLTYPHPDIFFQLIAGPQRGLLFVAPILILAPFGLARLIRTPATRDLGIAAAALAIVMLLYNASYYYWNGGYSTGPRHAIPAMAFLALGLAPLWASAGKSARRLIGALLALSLFINLAIAAAEVTAPDTILFPLWDPILKHFLELQIRTIPSDWWGWKPGFGLALYLTVALPVLWLLWHGADLSEPAARPIQEPVA